MEHILIIEDDDAILLGLEDNLRAEGYDVSIAKDGIRGFAMAQENSVDAIILDLMIPGIGGLDVCRRLRAGGIATPILILSARSLETDKVLGLELGADDYVTKPYGSRELVARIRALLRRAKPDRSSPARSRIGRLTVDFQRYEARREDTPVHLTALEYALLHYFINHRGKVLTRSEILDGVWGDTVYVNSKTVDTHVAHLRRKIEEDPGCPRFLVGIRGIGYRFDFGNEGE
jgi:DNA-binding response OmpR family regulator